MKLDPDFVLEQSRRMKHLVQQRATLDREDLEYVVERVAKMKDARLQECIAELIGWGVSIQEVARRLDVKLQSIERVALRRGTEQEKAVIMRALQGLGRRRGLEPRGDLPRVAGRAGPP